MDILDRVKQLQAIFEEGPRSMNQEPRNMYSEGQLVTPSVDGSRPGYQGDNKYTPSKGTPGVKLDAKQIKNISDDIANYPGISLKKVGDSYYFRFRIQKGDNKISESKVATKENLNFLKKRQKKFMKKNYPNILSNADFENLRMQEANINLSAKDFSEVLNKKNKTTIQGYNWTKDTVQKLQGDLKLNSYVQPGGASGKLRPINDAKKIVRGFNPEELKRLNQIPDINLRNAAIRNKASSITGRISYIKKTGTLQGITKNNQGSLWKNFYESSKKNNRITLGGTFNGKDLSFRKNWPKKADGTIDWFIKDKKTNKPAWQMLEFTDTQTPKGQMTFTYEGLQNQVDDAFGKGYFARSTNVYSKSRELYGKNIMFEGKMQPVGRVIAKQKIINDFKKNNNGKMPTEEYINKRITTSTPTQVHHTKGIGNDPYSVQLVSRDANQKLNAAELTYTSELKKAKGDPLKIKTLNNNFKTTINQISNTYGGIQYNVDGSVVGKKATGETAYTSAIQESGMPKNQQKNILQIVRNNKQKSITDAAIKTAEIGGFGKKIKAYCGGKASGGRIGFKNGTDVCPAATKDPEGFLKRLTADAEIGKFFKSSKAVGIAKNVARAGLNAVNPLSFVGGEIFYVGLESANSVGKGVPLDEALDKAFIFYNFDRTEKKIMAKAKEQGFDENQLNLLQSTINLNRLDNKQLAIEKQFDVAKDDYSEMSSDVSMGAEMALPEVNKQIADESQKYVNSLDKMGFDLSKDESYNTGFNYLDNVFRKKTKDELVKVYDERKRKLDPEGGFIGDAIKPIFDTQSYTQPLKFAADIINPFTKNVPFETDRAREQRYLNEMDEKELYLYNKRRGFDLDSVLAGTSPYIDKAIEDKGYGQAILGKGLFQDYSGLTTNRYAGGGIAGLSGGDKSGPPPESGPASQGLRSLFNNGKKQ